MNKLTKVLSVFLIAGLIGTGAAATMTACDLGGEGNTNQNQTTEYKVTFDLQGHGTAIAQATTVGGKITAPTAPTAEGWVFGGWYKEAACTTEVDFTAAFTADTTIYAKWTAAREEVKITFDLQGHGETIAQATTVDGKVAAPAAPTAEGWVFGGWYKEAACTTEVDFTAEFDADTTIYAKWTAAREEVKITFDLQGHGEEIAQATTVGGKITAPTAPTAEGWVFGGWYKEAACTTEVDFAAEFDADTTIYAKWTDAYEKMYGSYQLVDRNGSGALVLDASDVLEVKNDKTCKITQLLEGDTFVINGTWEAVSGETYIKVAMQEDDGEIFECFVSVDQESGVLYMSQDGKFDDLNELIIYFKGTALTDGAKAALEAFRNPFDCIVSGEYVERRADYDAETSSEIYVDGHTLTVNKDTKKVTYDGTVADLVYSDYELTFTIGEDTHTLSKDEEDRYYEVDGVKLMPKVTDYNLDVSDFVGIYTLEKPMPMGRYGGKNYAATEVTVYENVNMLVKLVEVDNKYVPVEGGDFFYMPSQLYGEISVDKYNVLHFGNGSMEALNDDATKVYLDGAIMIKKTAVVEELVDVELVDGTYVSADSEYKLVIDSEGYYYVVLNDMYGSSSIIGGNETDGYILFTTIYQNDDFVPVNYVIKGSTVEDVNIITIYKMDGTTVVATLTEYVVTYPVLAVDGTTIAPATSDGDDNGLVWYEVEESGWYKITAVTGFNFAVICNEYDPAHYSVEGKSFNEAGDTLTIYLEEGTYVGLNVLDFASIKVEATQAPKGISADSPVVITEGVGTFSNPDTASDYYFEFTAVEAGSYLISINNEACFTVGDKKYGYAYNPDTWQFDELQNGANCSVTLTAGQKLIIVADCKSAEWAPAQINVSVVQDIASGAVALTLTEGTATIAESGVYKTAIDEPMATGLKLTAAAAFTVTLVDGSDYEAQDEGGTYTVVISVRDANAAFAVTASGAVTATLQLFTGFTAAQQGTKTFEVWGVEVVVKIGATGVTYSGQIYVDGEEVNLVDQALTFVGAYEGTSVWAYGEKLLQLDFKPSGILTITDYITGYGNKKNFYPEFSFDGFGAAAGTYYFMHFNAMMQENCPVYITLNADKTITHNYNGYSIETLTVVACVNGVYTAVDGWDNIFEFYVNGDVLVVSQDEVTTALSEGFEADRVYDMTNDCTVNWKEDYFGKPKYEGDSGVFRGITIDATSGKWTHSNNEGNKYIQANANTKLSFKVKAGATLADITFTLVNYNGTQTFVAGTDYTLALEGGVLTVTIANNNTYIGTMSIAYAAAQE